MASHSMAYSRRLSGRGVSLVDYGKEVEQEIASLQALIEENDDLTQRYNSRWLAIKLLEEDSDIRNKVAATPNAGVILEQAERSVAHLGDIYGDDVDTVIADRRYGWINGLVRETVHQTSTDRLTLSDRIDRIVTNRILGIPIFLAMMWIVFKLTTDVASPMLDWV
ncbi:MAG: hypothetical protein ACP5G7_03275, partial [Anaerolineae bacterium]